MPGVLPLELKALVARANHEVLIGNVCDFHPNARRLLQMLGDQRMNLYFAHIGPYTFTGTYGGGVHLALCGVQLANSGCLVRKYP